MFPVNNRIKDVIIALNVANNFDQTLGRLRIQKLIYLADIISLYWGILKIHDGHLTYKHGPYDVDIQNSVDVLAFRGFVTIVDSNLMEDGRVTASYKLSRIGTAFYSKIEDNNLFRSRIKLYNAIGAHVNQRGWQELKALVYLEPTYCYLKGNGWGYRLDYSSLLTNQTLRILDDFRKMLNQSKQKQLTSEDFTSIYFKLLEAKLAPE
jgi:uncharacterized protein YwgA